MDNPREDITQPPLSRPAPPENGLPALGPACPLSWKRALVELLVVFAALLAPSVFMRLVLGLQAEDLARRGYWLYGYVLIQGSFALAAIGIVLALDREGPRSVGLTFKSLIGEILAAGTALGVIYIIQFLIALAVLHVSPKTMEELAEHRKEVAELFPRLPLLWIALFALFVGFYEEVLFRGFLITRLKFIVRNIWAALIISSLLFGVIHSYQDLLAMVQISIIAVIMGGLFILRGNLTAPILVHTVFDFANLTVYMYGPEIMNRLQQQGILRSVTHVQG